MKRSRSYNSTVSAASSLLHDGALPLQLVLQHAFEELDESKEGLCSLLCSSKSVRDALLQHCTGLVPVVVEGSSAECEWLSQYGLLAKALQVTLPPEADQHQGELAVAAALHKAAKAAAGGALRLQAYMSATATPAAGAVLSQLPSSCLRHLYLSFPKYLGHQGSSNLAFALQRLQNLTSVALLGAPVAPLLPVISSMQQLTQLELAVEVSSLGQLGVLPVQLRSLTLSIQAPSSSVTQQQRTQPLQLTHLTALQELCSNQSDTLQRLALQPRDQLPGGLLRVQLGLCSCKQLVQLRSLQEMDLQDSTLTSWDLFQIKTTLTSLYSVVLHYSAKGAAEAAATRWPSLPIECLGVAAAEPIAPVVYTALGGLGSRLRELILHAYFPARQPDEEQQQEQQQQQQDGGMWQPPPQQQQAAGQQKATAAQLAAALGQLTGLVSLDLHGDLVDWTVSSDISSSSSSDTQQAALFPEQAAAAAAAATERTKLANMRAVVGAIAQLTRLRCLELSLLPLGQAAHDLRHLGMGQLRRLKLAACGLTDVDVACLLLRQCKVSLLGIHYEPEITDGILPIIAHSMPQLKALSLTECSQISSEGLYCLRGMTQLRHLLRGRPGP